MDALPATQPKFCPVFILPEALNSCAEDAARAIVDLLLNPPIPGLVIGPVFVLDGTGIVDLRESYTECMHGRSFAGAFAASSACQESAVLAGGAVIGEGLPLADGMATPLMIEVDGDTALDPGLPTTASTGFMVACSDARMMLSLAARHAGAPACYVQAREEDMPLARLLGAVLRDNGSHLKISSTAPDCAWLLGAELADSLP
ncbi:hypothetical protein GTP45_16615 [Pseudoduganella sp. FT55W]|uniref:Uncharacterized protein n=1 Tax=Duganella rivi TaxID=2666083 RepID=A0A7X4GRU4_9BURK|nr:hypothetical protein [Duganella rivi]MYM68441.1 hypothetical protein [Duganella rivi]